MKKKILAFIAAVFVCTLVIYAFNGKNNMPMKEMVVEHQDLETEKRIETEEITRKTVLSTKPAEIPEGTEHVVVTGLAAGYAGEELVKESSLVVYGEIMAISEGFKVLGPEGQDGIMTDITISPIETYRGEVRDEITIRLEGGLADGVYEDYSDYPEFKLGEEWMFFLYKEETGGGLNTDDDYYYLVGISGGAFMVIDDELEDALDLESDIVIPENDTLFVKADSVKYGDPKFTLIEEEADLIEAEENHEEILAVLSDAAMKEYMPILNEKYPPEEANVTKEQKIAVYKSNYENDVITYEAYQEMVAALDEYAEIVS